ncbi:MAG: hypothetical protein ACLQU3_27595 [Limisphaerales bacterium]
MLTGFKGSTGKPFGTDDSKPAHKFSAAETEAIKTFFREEEDIEVLQLSIILVHAWDLIGEQCRNKDGSIYRYGACQGSRSLLHFFKHFEQILSDVDGMVTKMYPKKGSVFDYTPIEQLVAIKYFLKKWDAPEDVIEEIFTKLFPDTWQDYQSLHPPRKTSLPNQIKREQTAPEEAADDVPPAVAGVPAVPAAARIAAGEEVPPPPAAKTMEQDVKVEGRRAPVVLTGQEAPPEETSDGVDVQTCLEELTRLRELYNNLPEDNPERAKALALLQHIEQVLREHGVEPPAVPPAAAKPFNPKACEAKMASLKCRMRMLDCGQEEHRKLMEEWRELYHQLDAWKAQQPKPVEKTKAEIIHQAPARPPLPRPAPVKEARQDVPAEPSAAVKAARRAAARANQVEQTGDQEEREQPEHHQALEKAQKTHDQVAARLAASRAHGAGQDAPDLAEEGYDNDQELAEPPRRRGGRNPNMHY